MFKLVKPTAHALAKKSGKLSLHQIFTKLHVNNTCNLVIDRERF